MNKSIFNDILHDTLQHSPECEAATYIDLLTATNLGMYFYPNHEQPNRENIINLLTNTVIELFNGKYSTALAEHFKYQQNIPPKEEYFQEVIIAGINHTCVCVRLQFNPNHVLAFIFSNNVGRGLILTEVKQFVSKIQMIAEKTDLNITQFTDEHTIHSTKSIPLPHPTLVFNVPPDNPPKSKPQEEEKNNIFSALERWLRN